MIGRLRGLLDPVERFSEILFGLIMVLTFTGSISAAESGRAEIRTMLYGAVGCNLAWGIVDGIMYILSVLAGRGRGALSLRALRASTDPERARRIIGDALPPVVAGVMRPADFDRIRGDLQRLPETSLRGGLHKDDLLAAFAVSVLVFLSTFPVVIPFIVMHDAHRALRWSNGVAIVMLYLTGRFLGRYAGYRPWVMGVSMVFIGLVLVGLTMALGG